MLITSSPLVIITITNTMPNIINITIAPEAMVFLAEIIVVKFRNKAIVSTLLPFASSTKPLAAQ